MVNFKLNIILLLFFCVACESDLQSDTKTAKKEKVQENSSQIEEKQKSRIDYAMEQKANQQDLIDQKDTILQREDQEDPRIWLENVEDEKALAQVRKWNQKTSKGLETDPRYQTSNETILKIVDDQDKIIYGYYHNGEVWNFWRDTKTHIRGIYRKTSLKSYLSGKPEWKTIIDIDELAKKEKKNWVYKGIQCFSRGGSAYSNCLLYLSDGGKDAITVREFDVQTKQFIKNGFNLKEAKSRISWYDRNHLLVATDYGADSLNESGYPRILKLWKRGTPISEAVTILEGEKTDIFIFGMTIDRSDEQKSPITLVSIGKTFYDYQVWWMREDRHLIPLPISPKTDVLGIYKGEMLIALRDDWRGFKKGAILSFSFDEFMKNGEINAVNLVYASNDHGFINSTNITKSGVLISIYENVKGAIYLFNYVNGNWSSEKIIFSETEGKANQYKTINVTSSNKFESIVFVNTEGFLESSTLWFLDLLKSETSDQPQIQQIKKQKSWFDSEHYVVRQKHAVSSDGVRIPYFIIHKKNIELTGKNPTLLYGYGGFEISMLPYYSGVLGKLWLDKGGVYVLSNIRGGGEFGPRWHQAGLKTKRQIIYDDFIAIAEKLINEKITSPEKLAIQGGSNGGLLMGVMYTQRPDLWNAIVCSVPLLDMLRYHKLLAGASWVGEYGDPDIKEERAFLETISPYHNVRKNVNYPEILFVTSTKDDRVHPGHARKMAKLLEENGFPFEYYENIDGGHAASTNYKNYAHKTALQYVFLYQNIMDDIQKKP